MCGTLLVNASENGNGAFFTIYKQFLCFDSEKPFSETRKKPSLHICTFVVAQWVVRAVSSKLSKSASICLPRECKHLLLFFIISVT